MILIKKGSLTIKSIDWLAMFQRDITNLRIKIKRYSNFPDYSAQEMAAVIYKNIYECKIFVFTIHVGEFSTIIFIFYIVDLHFKSISLTQYYSPIHIYIYIYIY